MILFYFWIQTSFWGDIYYTRSFSKSFMNFDVRLVCSWQSAINKVSKKTSPLAIGSLPHLLTSPCEGTPLPPPLGRRLLWMVPNENCLYLSIKDVVSANTLLRSLTPFYQNKSYYHMHWPCWLLQAWVNMVKANYFENKHTLASSLYHSLGRGEKAYKVLSKNSKSIF